MNQKSPVIRELGSQPSEIPAIIKLLEQNHVDTVLHGKLLMIKLSAHWNLLDDLPAGLWLLELDGTISYANRRMSRIMGVSADEMTGMAAMDFIWPEDRPAFRNVWENTRWDQEGIQAEYRFKGKQAFPVSGFFGIRPVTDAHCHRSGYVAMVSDITEQQQTIEKLIHNELIFRRLAETNLFGVGVGDTRGNIAYVNDEMLRMMGRTREEYNKGLINWAESLHPMSRDEIQDWGTLLAETGITPAYERVFLKPDGTRTPYLGKTAVVVPGEDLQVRIALDLTDIKKTEQSLRTKENRLRLASSALQIGIFEWDVASDRFSWKNKRLFDILGLSESPEPFTMNDFIERLIIPGDQDFFQQSIRQALNAIDKVQIIFRIQRARDTKECWLALSGIFQQNEFSGSPCLIGVLSDITERKEMENQLHSFNRNLEQLISERTAELKISEKKLRRLTSQLTLIEQQEKERLAQILHDQIQPTIVASRMQLWEVKRRAPDCEDIINKVESALSDALKQLRSLSTELKPIAIKTSGLNGGLKWLADTMAEQYRLKVTVFYDINNDVFTEESATLLFSCVKELLLNIVKYARVDSADIAVSQASDKEVRITVSDLGIGFNPTILESMEPEEMTFGLYSIRERLLRLKGRMHIASSPGKGTHVTLTIPVDQSFAAELRANHPDQASSEKSADKTIQTVLKTRDHLGVLIVDDHHLLREGLRGLLQMEPDIDVLGEAEDDTTAVELTEALNPDVIIMDIELGNADGIQLTRQIHSRFPHIKIIGLSMHDDKQTENAMLEAGACAFRPKTCPSDDLIDTIKSCARKSD